MAPAAGKAAGWGALLCALYALAHVALNGVVIDETVVSAQILNGAVDYPAGHPHEVFHRAALSLPNHVSAALWRLAPGLEVVSGARNVLFLFLSAFVPYLVATLWTGRPLWGLVASALVLTDCAWLFRGVYPTFVFPTFYSHGHVGAYGALLVVALIAGRFHRLGGFLLGLFPAVHPLLAALVWGWSALALPFVPERRRVLAWAAAGVVVALGSFALSRVLAVEAIPAPEYRPEPGGEEVRANFIAFTDLHRQMPAATTPTFQFGYLANCVLFAVGGALLLALARGAEARRRAAAVLGLGALAWLAVWGARTVHELTGRLPEVLETAMPNRLSNLSASLLVPLYVAVLAVASRRSPRLAGAALALATAALLAGGGVAAADAFFPDLWVGEKHRLVALFVVVGAGLAAGFVASPLPVGRLAALLAAVFATALAYLRRDWLGAEAAFLLAGAFAGAAALLFVAARGTSSVVPPGEALDAGPRARFACVLAALLCAAATLRTSQAGESSRVHPFDRDLNAWLAAEARPDELILPPLLPRTQLQAKTGHPVLFELGTLWLMPYLPELSSVIGRMSAELYGVDYADHERLERLAKDGYLSQYAPVWRAAWVRRGREDWQRLGERYGFRLVLAPTDWGVGLEPELVSVEWTLYSIPG